MPTAINVKEEKKAKTNIVRFETSTSPNWKDIKMFIRKNFFKTLTQLQKNIFSSNYKFKRITIPKITRQTINIFTPFVEKYFNKKSIANKEDKNVVIKPTKRGRKPNEKNSLKEEVNSTIAAIEIAGIPKRKENFAASPLSHPDIKALEIVTPDLETPGKIANA